ncbi:DNA translocase FtsK [Patescibacteria group bacterium]|nr:DNA translocase FtsK [Patescibacteria group bacterium]
MARTKRRRKFKLKLKKPSLNLLLAFLLVTMGLLALFSILGLTRSILNGFADTLNNLLGWGVLLFPVISIVAGLYLAGFENKKINLRSLVGLLMFLIGALGATGLFSSNAAGEFGTFLAQTSKRGFTPTGAFFVFSALMLASLKVIFNWPWKEFLGWIIKIPQALTVWLYKRTEGWVELLKRKQISAAKEIVITENPEARPEEPAMEPKIIGGEYEKHPEREKAKTMDEQISVEEEQSPDITAGEKETDSIHPSGNVPSIEWKYPPLSLLSDEVDRPAERGDIQSNIATITQKLKSFGMEAEVAEVNLGPAVTQYALKISEETKISRITSLQNDLALALATPTGTVRIEAPIPGRSLVGVEVPNQTASLVSLRSVLESEPMQNAKSKLTIPLGLDVGGKTITASVNRWPHMLIAGATGSGKSVLLHTFVNTLLFRCSPDDLKLILIDPKRVELTLYDGIPHLLTPVITKAEKVITALKWAVAEMESRYEKLQAAGVRNISGYNQIRSHHSLPHVIIIVDELADIMAFAANEIEKLICRIAQMSRATGIHLILSTQRPSVDVITGLIKANIPARIALNVSSSTDSRVIIDTTGAEKLLGKGDMLYLPPDLAKPTRIQGVFVSQKEIKDLLDFIRTENIGYGETLFKGEENAKDTMEDEISKTAVHDEPDDPLFSEAVQIILDHKRASASLLQRRLSIGYARAARILDELQERGVISPRDGSKPREVYAVRAQEYLGKASS